MNVNDFRWIKGENDLEYIRLLEEECKRKDEIISRLKNKVIRCRDCKYLYTAKYGKTHKWCDRVSGACFTVTDDGFCAWAERKE